MRLNKSISFNRHRFSVKLKEDNIAIFEKLTKRIEHITGLKANTSQFGAEHMLVSCNKCYSYDGIQSIIFLRYQIRRYQKNLIYNIVYK